MDNRYLVVYGGVAGHARVLTRTTLTLRAPPAVSRGDGRSGDGGEEEGEGVASDVSGGDDDDEEEEDEEEGEEGACM